MIDVREIAVTIGKNGTKSISCSKANFDIAGTETFAAFKMEMLYDGCLAHLYTTKCPAVVHCPSK